MRDLPLVLVLSALLWSTMTIAILAIAQLSVVQGGSMKTFSVLLLLNGVWLGLGFIATRRSRCSRSGIAG